MIIGVDLPWLLVGALLTLVFVGACIFAGTDDQPDFRWPGTPAGSFPPLERPVRPTDVIRIDGKLHTVVAVEWASGNVRTETLGERLASVLYIDGEKKTVGELLVEGGWLPPWKVEEIGRMLGA